MRGAPCNAAPLDAAFNRIRQAGSSKPAVLVHMLKAIGSLAEHVRTEEQREPLKRHAQLLQATGERADRSRRCRTGVSEGGERPSVMTLAGDE